MMSSQNVALVDQLEHMSKQTFAIGLPCARTRLAQASMRLIDGVTLRLTHPSTLYSARRPFP